MSTTNVATDPARRPRCQWQGIPIAALATLVLAAWPASADETAEDGEQQQAEGAGATPQAVQPAPQRRMSPASQMALQVGKYIDNAWEVVPDNDTAQLRFLFRLDGRPFAGKISLMSEFTFRAIDEENERIYNVGLNPNLNGRWFLESVAPGTYDVVVIGQGRFAGWEWRRQGLDVQPNTAPLFELDLEPTEHR